MYLDATCSGDKSLDDDRQIPLLPITHVSLLLRGILFECAFLQVKIVEILDEVLED